MSIDYTDKCLEENHITTEIHHHHGCDVFMLLIMIALFDPKVKCQTGTAQNDKFMIWWEEYYHYSLNGHPSRPENRPFFQHSHVCTWQCHTLKCSATHPVFSPARNISRLFYVIFLLCTMNQNQLQLQPADKNNSHWQLELWVNGLVN